MRWATRARTGAAVLAVLGALTLATGCAANNGPVDLANVAPATPPLPGGVQEGQHAVPSTGNAGATPPAQCGDPTASLSPPSSMPTPGQMPAGSTMAKIQARGKLIVGVDQNTYLFGYRNPKHNTLEGFDIDMVKDIEQAIFGSQEPRYVEYKAITSAQRITALTSGQVDMVVRTFTVNCARKQQVAFSAVYYQAQRRLLVENTSSAQSINDMAGKKVCATAGSDSLSQSGPVPVAVNDWSDCLVLLQQGQVDGITTDDTILAGMAAQDPNTKIVGPPIAPEPYGIAMPLHDDDLVRFVNGVLAQVKSSGSWTRSYTTWVGDRLGATPAPPQATYAG